MVCEVICLPVSANMFKILASVCWPVLNVDFRAIPQPYLSFLQVLYFYHTFNGNVWHLNMHYLHKVIKHSHIKTELLVVLRKKITQQWVLMLQYARMQTRSVNLVSGRVHCHHAKNQLLWEVWSNGRELATHERRSFNLRDTSLFHEVKQNLF
jgi:hypothetical protein